MIDICNLTVVCVDTINHRLALIALNKTLMSIKPKRCLLFSDMNPDLNNNNAIEIIPINKLESINEYNDFILKRMVFFIDTTHALIVQYDGYVINPQAWRDDFLNYDYIGAVWPFRPDDRCVGNGGFSLRSKKLLEALTDSSIVSDSPEDDVICLIFRDYLEKTYKIRFADKYIASYFSVEKSYTTICPFGFHGIFNLNKFLSDSDINEFIIHSHTSIFRKLEFIELIHNLFIEKRIRIALSCASKSLLNKNYPAVLLSVLRNHLTEGELESFLAHI